MQADIIKLDTSAVSRFRHLGMYAGYRDCDITIACITRTISKDTHELVLVYLCRLQHKKCPGRRQKINADVALHSSVPLLLGLPLRSESPGNTVFLEPDIAIVIHTLQP